MSMEKFVKEFYAPTHSSFMMFYDYVEAVAFLHERRPRADHGSWSASSTNWRIAKIYNVPLTAGISVTGNLTGSYTKFLMCLQRGVVDWISLEKVRED